MKRDQDGTLHTVVHQDGRIVDAVILETDNRDGGLEDEEV